MKQEPETFSQMNQAGQEIKPVTPARGKPIAMSELLRQDLLAKPLTFIELMQQQGQVGGDR